uniref:plastid-encoded DNA-directed RNA polymerase beta'' subunit n=1 Tax=Pyropia seriata TaxID=79731 RepID=UPI002869FC37|nr:plastid-encoded DNA-directed RNA polymerase beta'' subunit [Neoporphyra seriata]WKD84009.1 plastid-encoded DNA-directed RNA polymerase beta'' subunit [Neoporphyra seriata]
MDNRRSLAQPSFSNKVIDKNELKNLIVWAFRNYGIARAANMADKLKDLGFHYATQAGISLSLEDLRIPPSKQSLLVDTIEEIKATENRYRRGEITAVERFQKVIDTWNNASESLKQEVIKYFKETDPLNAVYMMAFSGARGNISQVRQLVGMRGLMADPQGQIIDLPISSNFREGLTVTDYFISSYGARKGLVDTALRTADSGYLTRRLVDVSQDVIIREVDCRTNKGIILEDLVDTQKILINLEQALSGRVLAENVFHPDTHVLIAHTKQDISPKLAKEITKAGIKKVLVRSPVTCNSRSSVCQYCYGWNLAHGRLVDLGEAVGIIAAQSIGEPGTQLTMRTFHTGGVFTGELAEQIYAPIDGQLTDVDIESYTDVRTRHGEQALITKHPTQVTIRSRKNQKSIINLSKGTTLLLCDGQSVLKDQVIAESPRRNRLMTERAQKHVVSDLSGKICFSNLTVEETDNNQYTTRITKTGGLIWILSGEVYSISDSANVIVNKEDETKAGTIIAQTELINQYAGEVRIQQNTNSSITNIQIITESIVIPGCYIYTDSINKKESYILETEKKQKFLFKAVPNQKIHNGYTVAELISDTYKTTSGGIIKYLDLNVSKKKTGSDKDAYEILSPGYILWIAEETHEINKDASLLLVYNGDIIESGTELVKNIFSKSSGIVEIVQKDGIVREIIIKPGSIYKFNEVYRNHDKSRGFLRPGETLHNNISTDKLVYWEYIENEQMSYILIRPVIVYSIPETKSSLIDNLVSQKPSQTKLKLVKRTPFRDGERVKSIEGVHLVTTNLIAEIEHTDDSLMSSIEFSAKERGNNYFDLRLSTFETLSIKSIDFNKSEKQQSQTRIIVKNGEYIKPLTVVASTEIIAMSEGIIEEIYSEKNNSRRILIVTSADKKTFNTKGAKTNVNIGDWVRCGDFIAENIVSLDSGQIVQMSSQSVTLRIARPYLVSNGAILHVDNNALIRRGETLAILVFDRAKTGDIIQGLPRIEEILEARKKTDVLLNPHDILDASFNLYIECGLALYEAARLSFQEIQLLLVKEVQLVYQSQGVNISDKHVEVIVRQMTSKVKIENGEETGYLPGELVELQKIEQTNKAMTLRNKLNASYRPVLLGITQASLNTESFISAASFQETTKVLTEAAISGKLDWLRGLKENVIIGRLIPAGTGFNTYDNHNRVALEKKDSTLDTSNESRTSSVRDDLDDIILDDRTARNYFSNKSAD